MNEKIGMYTEDEILEHLTEGEGRGFLGRSMYDAIFDKIHALKTEKEQLQQENTQLKESYSKLEGKYFANVPCCNENDCDLYRDYMKLKDNWNKLKEYLENKIDEYSINLEYLSAERMTQIKNKMQELEQGSDINE